MYAFFSNDLGYPKRWMTWMGKMMIRWSRRSHDRMDRTRTLTGNVHHKSCTPMTLQKIQGNSVMSTSDWQMSLAQVAQGLDFATRNLAPMILSFKNGWRRCVAGWIESHVDVSCFPFFWLCPDGNTPQRSLKIKLSVENQHIKVDFFWASLPSPDVFSSSALMNQLQRWQQWDVALAHLDIFQGCDQQLYHAGIAALQVPWRVGLCSKFGLEKAVSLGFE